MDIAPSTPLPASEPRAPFHVDYDGARVAVHGELATQAEVDALLDALAAQRRLLPGGER